jgi:hypothetical protein
VLKRWRPLPSMRIQDFGLVRQVMLWQTVAGLCASEGPAEDSGKDDKPNDQSVVHDRVPAVVPADSRTVKLVLSVAARLAP